MLACLAFYPFAPTDARAQGETLKGVALVLGQSTYEHLSSLPNPTNDARGVDRLLSDLGFEVARVTNADGPKLVRALRRFVEDAAGADVALIYYSGHGIEAGGENYLVPVDAEISALDAAGERLVPLSRLLSDLQAAAPVSIVLLDACRDSPFPPGALVRAAPGAPPVAVAAAGLSVPRGAVPLLTGKVGAPAAAGFGSLVGFAAAPGRVALDGEPGGNSPYAAALLKHMAAGGYPFADVMTMVSEEVWLKTRAVQTPWTNTSLRRQLWFGGAGDEGREEDAEIRRERRGLLLRIAALGEAERRQVASRAADTGVPMDALFAMLAAIGMAVPQDPDEFDRLLREQAARLKGILSDRSLLSAADPEMQQLAELADQAISEGALQAAIGFNERAKRRVAELSQGLDDVQVRVDRRRGEFAALYARSAETYTLAYDFEAAARDYAAAYEQVSRSDPGNAWQYRALEAEALEQHGFYRADGAAARASVARYREVLALVPKAERPVEWAQVQSGLGRALWTQAGQSGDRQLLAEAVAALESALTVQTPEETPLQWAGTQGTLGVVLQALGVQEQGMQRLEASIEALQAGLRVLTRSTHPLEWARLQNRLGVTYVTMAERDAGAAYLDKALAAFEAAAQERRRDRVPYDWAQTRNNIALVHAHLADRVDGVAHLAQAAESYRLALEVYDRERTPLLWAEGKSNLGSVYWQMAHRTEGLDEARAAAAAFQDALDIVNRTEAPMHWAALQDNLGSALKLIGLRTDDTVPISEARLRYEAALEERRRDVAPVDWAATTVNLANALAALGARGADAGMIDRAVGLYGEAMEISRREESPLEWARIMSNLGIALYTRGLLASSMPHLERAEAAIRLALEEHRRERMPLEWARGQVNLARVLLERGRRGGERAPLDEALGSVEEARGVYARTTPDQFESSLGHLEAEIRLAALRIDVEDQMKQAGSQGR